MALERIGVESTTIQPTPKTSPVDVQANVALAQTEGATAVATGEMAGQVQQISSNIMKAEAADMAAKDAKSSIKFDPKTGEVLPIDRSAKGYGGLVYEQGYEQAVEAQFGAAFLSQAQRRGQQYITENPTSPEDVARKMTLYSEASLKGIPDERLRATLAPELAQIHAQSVAAATANRTKANQQAFLEDARNATDQYTTAYSLSAAGGTLAQDKPLLDAKRERAISLNAQSGMGPVALENEGKKIDAFAVASGQARQLYERAKGLDPSSPAWAGLMTEIDKISSNSEFPSLVRPVLENAMNKARNFSGFIDAAYQRQTQEVGGRVMGMFLEVEEMRRQQNLDGSPMHDPKTIADKMEQVFQKAIMATSGLRQMDQARILTSTHATSQQQVQKYLGAQFATTTQNAQYGSPAEQKVAIQELQGFIADPRMQAFAAEGGPINNWMAQARRTVAQHKGAERVTDMVALQTKLGSEDVSELDRNKLIAAAGPLIGFNSDTQLHPLQVAQLAARGNAAYAEKQKGYAKTGAILGITNPTDPSKPIGTLEDGQAATLRKDLPLVLGQSMVNGVRVDNTYNAQNPIHKQIRTEWTSRTGLMPQQWIDDVASIPNTTDEPTVARKAQVLNEVASLRAKKKMDYGPQMDADKLGEFTEAQMQQAVGKENYERIRKWEDHGPGADSKTVVAGGETPGRNVGEVSAGRPEVQALLRDATNDALNQSMTGELMQVGAPITQALLSVFPKSVRDNFSAELWKKTRPVFKELAARGGLADVRIDGEKLTMDAPDAEIFNGRVEALLKENGKFWRDSGLNPYTQAAIQVLQGTDRGGDFAMQKVMDVDGNVSGHKIAYRPTTMMLNKAGNTNWTEDQQIKFMAGYAWQQNALMMQNIRPETMQFFSKPGPGGKVEHWLTGLDRSNNPQRIVRFDPEDDKLEIERKKIGDNIAREMEDGVWGQISWLPTAELWRGMIMNNKLDGMLRLAASDHDFSAYSAVIDGIKTVLPFLTTGHLPEAYTNTLRLLDTMNNRKSFEAINRFGSPYYFIFGNRGIDPLSGLLGNQTRYGEGGTSSQSAGAMDTTYVPFQRDGQRLNETNWPPPTDPVKKPDAKLSIGEQFRNIVKGNLGPKQEAEAAGRLESTEILQNRAFKNAERLSGNLEEGKRAAAERVRGNIFPGNR